MGHRSKPQMTQIFWSFRPIMCWVQHQQRVEMGGYHQVMANFKKEDWEDDGKPMVLGTVYFQNLFFVEHITYTNPRAAAFVAYSHLQNSRFLLYVHGKYHGAYYGCSDWLRFVVEVSIHFQVAILSHTQINFQKADRDHRSYYKTMGWWDISYGSTWFHISLPNHGVVPDNIHFSNDIFSTYTSSILGYHWRKPPTVMMPIRKPAGSRATRGAPNLGPRQTRGWSNLMFV